MTDFEQRVKELVNQHVDDKLGPRREPAPFHPTSPPSRGRWVRPGLAPLLAAACVIALAAGMLTLSGVFNNPDRPAGHSGSVSLPPPSPSNGPPTPTHTASTTPTNTAPVPQHTPPPGAHIAHVLGATLVLPDGWRVTGTRRVGSGFGAEACLGRVGSQQDCLIHLDQLAQTAAPHDVDLFHLGFGDLGQYCGMRGTWSWTYADSTLGGRAADWRSWQLNCPNGMRLLLEQYAVVTTPGYLLWTESTHDIAVIRHAMYLIAHYTALPAQTAPLRWFDRGIIRSVARDSNGVAITLDRVIYKSTLNCSINHNPQTYTYVVPPQVFDAHAHPLGVGAQVTLSTDGRTVKTIEREHLSRC